MTKKTQSRVARDLKAKGEAAEYAEVTSRCWDELNELHAACATALTSSARVIPILRNQQIIENIADIKELQSLAAVVAKDTKEYRESLAKIHSQHEGKSGGSDDTSILMSVIQIGEEYQQWLLSYHGVVSPGVQRILNMADAALRVINEKEKAKEEVTTEGE